MADSPKAETESVAESVESLGALRALGAATGRISALLGADVNAATRKAPEVALAILGRDPRVIVIRSATRLGAIQNATRFLDGLSDAIELRWSRRVPPGRLPEPKPFPNPNTGSPGRIKKIGGDR
jgi:hypothetical protein